MYQLPTITDLIEKEFMLENDVKQALAEPELEQSTQANQAYPYLFTTDQDGDIYYRAYLYQVDDHTDSQEWKLAPQLKEDATIHNLFASLHLGKPIVLKSKQGEMLGFTDALLLSRKIYSYLEELHAYFKTILETSDASITAIDETGVVKVWTKGAERIFSYLAEEIIARPITQFFDLDKLQIIKSLRQGHRLYRQQHQPRNDLFVLINTSPIYLHNKIIGAVATETDITQQVRLNQELFQVSTKVHHLEQEVAKLSPPQDPFQSIKGSSKSMKNIVNLAKKICTTEAPVLILGESGVGKELFAKAIHETRETADAPFIPINCGAIPNTLFESELFGYEKGAFSGADVRGKKGKIELAQGGSLFLDEVGEMPVDMQVKLLRVLEDKKFYRIGGTTEIKAEFRVIAATNRDLEQMVSEGKFREDLYYRLNVVQICIPPLRERHEDIVELAHYFLFEFSQRYNRPIHDISPQIMYELLQYGWPGNIRELRNCMERLVVFSTDGQVKKADLPFHAGEQAKGEEEPSTNTTIEKIPFYPNLSLAEQLARVEKHIILKTLEFENGNKLSSAERLGITRATLYNRLKKLNI